MKRIAGLAVLLIGSAVSILFMYTNVDLNPQEFINSPKHVLFYPSTFSSNHSTSFSRKISNLRNRLSYNFTHQLNGLKIMLVGRMRTGSTFIGEILNQNQNLFYLFEPLHGLDIQQRTGTLDKSWKTFSVEAHKLLRDINKCRFSASFISGIGRWPLARSKSKNVSPICKQSSLCKKVNQNLFNKECMKLNGNIAMKFIRSDIETLRPLVEVDQQNIKVIHLVRDPRGTANSRRSYYGKKTLKRNGSLPSLSKMGLLLEEPRRRMNTVPKLCQWMRKTVSYAIKQPPWLQGRYKILRYEDFSVDPLHTTKKIYKFLGLPLPKNVQDWLVNNTNAVVLKKTTFGTTRNSTYTATSWRSSLSLNDVLLVQHMCGDVMAELGYLKIYNESDLRNFSVPLFSSFEFNDFIL